MAQLYVYQASQLGELSTNPFDTGHIVVEIEEVE